jgi:hypothetical protein
MKTSDSVASDDAERKVYAGLTTPDGTGYMVTHFRWLRKYPSLVRMENQNNLKVIASFRSIEEAERFRDWMIALRPDAVDTD